MNIYVDDVGSQGSHCGTKNIQIQKGKKEPVRMDWNWTHWYDFMISHIYVCVCVCTYVHIKNVCMYIMCVHMYVYVGICVYS